jgi:hypothetical protein
VETNHEHAQVFYRWEDAAGRVHVVSSLDAVPASERAKAALVVLDGADSVSGHYTPGGVASWSGWPAFAAGFGVALLLVLVLRLLPSSWRALSRYAIVLAVVALLAGVYFGSVRRMTGTAGAGALATPGKLVEDAKSAVEKMSARQKQQDEELKKIETEARQ